MHFISTGTLSFSISEQIKQSLIAPVLVSVHTMTSVEKKTAILCFTFNDLYLLKMILGKSFSLLVLWKVLFIIIIIIIPLAKDLYNVQLNI